MTEQRQRTPFERYVWAFEIGDSDTVEEILQQLGSDREMGRLIF